MAGTKGYKPGHKGYNRKPKSETRKAELKRDLQEIARRAAKSKAKPSNVIATYACFMKYVDANKQMLLGRAVQMATEGDVYMLRFILERALPKVTDSVIPIQLDTSGTLTDVATRVIAHIGEQNLTPDQGVRVMQILKMKSELIESDAIMRRLQTLEEKAGIKDVQGETCTQVETKSQVQSALDQIAELKEKQSYKAEDEEVFTEDAPQLSFTPGPSNS